MHLRINAIAVNAAVAVPADAILSRRNNRQDAKAQISAVSARTIRKADASAAIQTAAAANTRADAATVFGRNLHIPVG